MQEEVELELNNINTKEDVVKILSKVYQNFNSGKFEEAIELLERALEIDFEHPEISSSLKCVNFWKERIDKLNEIDDVYERGEFLLNHWHLFSLFISKLEDVSERCRYNMKQFIYKLALENYSSLQEDAELYDIDLLTKMGRCYKGLGDYDKALEYMEIALQHRAGSAEIMAEMADCYFQINEIRLSKAFFREAFFLNPTGIDIFNLESGMIKKLIQLILNKGIKEDKVNLWIGVYGSIFGVFNIKRELKPLEIGKLKQSIFQMERSASQADEPVIDIIPKLINHYFWLIDHLVGTGEDKSKIEEILEKIKNLDLNIYKEYTN